MLVPCDLHGGSGSFASKPSIKGEQTAAQQFSSFAAALLQDEFGMLHIVGVVPVECQAGLFGHCQQLQQLAMDS